MLSDNVGTRTMQTKCVILRQNAADVRSQELSHRPSQMTTGLATATTKMTPSASVFTENVVEHSNWHLNDLSEGLFMSPALSALADDHPADATEPFVPFSMFDHSLSNRRNGPAQRVYTDIPVLDDLFSELNSDAPFDCSDETRVTAPSFDLADSFTAKSEPIDLADMERIMFPVHDRPTRKSIQRQPFSSRLASIPASLHASRTRLPVQLPAFDTTPSLPSGTSTGAVNDPHFSAGPNPFLQTADAANDSSFAMNGCLSQSANPTLMLWDGMSLSAQSMTTMRMSRDTSTLIHLQDAASSVRGGKIQVKVIGPASAMAMENALPGNGRLRHADESPASRHGTSGHVRSFATPNATYSSIPSTSMRPETTHEELMTGSRGGALLHRLTAAPPAVYGKTLPSGAVSLGTKASVPSYRTYGKKRHAIRPEYADFVCRLQNDIPFDSSEDDEDDDYHSQVRGGQKRVLRSDELSEEDEEEDECEDEKDAGAKISPQELLELFEDQCQGLPDDAPVSASLTHRKHQISLKGYRPAISHARSSPAVAMDQQQFSRLEDQLQKHFQLLVQNLALSNEIDGGEAVTLVSLKLLVQLHLHLDSTCNLLRVATTETHMTHMTHPSPLHSHPSHGTASPAVATPSHKSRAIATISCLNPSTPTPRHNPIQSRLSDLIPSGIHKVAVIAGFLARPGQKQFLSLSALRVDSALKPKSTCIPLSLRIKPHPQLNSDASAQLLSNAFYNIITLFHEHIDPVLLETTINVRTLSKHLELPSADTLVVGNDNGYYVNGTTGGSAVPGKTAKFLPSEDGLLLCGLRRFGCGNWDSIQAQFIPCRSARQLAIRYKNQSSRREPMNPIKDFNERLMMPLSELEEELLYRGVQRFGNQFYLITQHYLPHRPATVLCKLWKAMDDARR